ncbi:DUF4013 domain-containing protein [Methanoregula sp.]|uniref:DUF4013 domain-containing protein n=1 Tax=Methanoregula sp. TaxID=2052170 RepID=UPI002BB5FB49|nr:DUF4013 domain-containing protein [Methanoregula sp.]HVP97543.1 DUF4013 domain-containing protein [Methanoregula sp.]
MDYGAIVSDAAGYAKTALVKNPVTWLVFIICSLPFALFKFVCDPKTIIAGAKIHWELIPWTQIILLFLAGFLLSFVVSGYIVRVYRGTTPPPSFNAWVSLFIDGIKLTIVGFIWLVPAMILFIVGFVMIVSATVLGTASMPSLMSAGLIFLLIGLIVLVIAAIYAALGTVRFARTGSMREGLRFSEITNTIQAIGWGSYILALIIMGVLVILVSLIISLFALIPFVGWVIELILMPFVQVFSARYISRVYDHSVPPAPAPAV